MLKQPGMRPKNLQLVYAAIEWVLLVASVSKVEPFQMRVHPQCSMKEISEPLFGHLEDITSLMHGNTVTAASCIFNPTVTRLQGDLYLWAARIYGVHNPKFACSEDYTIPRPPLTYDGWRGINKLVLAVTRTTWIDRGPLKHELVGHAKIDVPMEDPRLFKDADGSPWLLMHYPRSGSMTVTFVNVTCSNTGSSGTSCHLELGGTRLLWFSKAIRYEKNWVPHNGTSRMSYPVYPTFTPHSVFDWGSYHFPRSKADFDSVAPEEPFFVKVREAFQDLVHFAGSTPAVLHDDGMSYVAIGHIRAPAFCFHDPVATNNISSHCQSGVAKRMRLKFFEYTHTDGRKYSHHYKEYAMFVYRFKATPTYEITHMSEAFIPCTAHHSGITFPAGLDRIGPSRDYLVTFGEANRYCRLLTISAANLDRLLRPMAEMREMAPNYSLCAMPCSNSS